MMPLLCLRHIVLLLVTPTKHIAQQWEQALQSSGCCQIKHASDLASMRYECTQQRPDIIVLDDALLHSTLQQHKIFSSLDDSGHHYTDDHMPPVWVIKEETPLRFRYVATLGVDALILSPHSAETVHHYLLRGLNVMPDYLALRHQPISAAHFMTERAKTQEQALQTDSVTGLPNRRALFSALHHYAEADIGVGVVVIALDGLYDIKNTHGDIISATVLRHLARLIHVRIEGVDALGVWGGHELMLITPLNSKAPLMQMASQLMQLFTEGLSLDAWHIDLRPRMGIHFTSQRFEADTFLHHAVQALPALDSPVRWQWHDELLSEAAKTAGIVA